LREPDSAPTEWGEIFLAGIAIPRMAVLYLARLVDDVDLATRLRKAVIEDDKLVTLEEDERHTLLRSLDDSPPLGFENLRATLLQETERRRAGGH